MQLASITPAAPVAAPRVDAPRFTGGIDFNGSGRFTKFSAHATDVVYGEAAGYETLQQAIDAVTWLTVGTRETAGGIFEHDGRFYGRRLDNEVTFANGASWKGAWRLEQYPADSELITGDVDGAITRAADLRAVVDGAQRFDVTHLPVN
jgi:hypothetical protein